MEKKAVDFYWWAEMEKIYCRIVQRLLPQKQLWKNFHAYR